MPVPSYPTSANLHVKHRPDYLHRCEIVLRFQQDVEFDFDLVGNGRTSGNYHATLRSHMSGCPTGKVSGGYIELRQARTGPDRVLARRSDPRHQRPRLQFQGWSRIDDALWRVCRWGITRPSVNSACALGWHLGSPSWVTHTNRLVSMTALDTPTRNRTPGIGTIRDRVHVPKPATVRKRQDIELNPRVTLVSRLDAHLEGAGFDDSVASSGKSRHQVSCRQISAETREKPWPELSYQSGGKPLLLAFREVLSHRHCA